MCNSILCKGKFESYFEKMIKMFTFDTNRYVKIRMEKN